jgi:hypothetical protein
MLFLLLKNKHLTPLFQKQSNFIGLFHCKLINNYQENLKIKSLKFIFKTKKKIFIF